MRRLARWMLLAALPAAAALACAPKPKQGVLTAPVPEATPWPSIENREGELVTREGRTVYRDGATDLTLTLPPGFVGRLSFPADPGGPPAVGRVRLRMADGGEARCVVDVATEPGREPASLLQSAAQGREVFFLAETGDPLPSTIPSHEVEVWAATFVPPAPQRIDVGYWVFAATLTIRVEGRFPVERLAECKEALDAIVRSIELGPRTAASRVTP